VMYLRYNSTQTFALAVAASTIEFWRVGKI